MAPAVTPVLLTMPLPLLALCLRPGGAAASRAAVGLPRAAVAAALGDEAIVSSEARAAGEARALLPPPWWVVHGVTPEGPGEDMGTWARATFSRAQQEHFGVGEHGEVLDQARFDAAVAALKAPAAAANEAAAEPSVIPKLAVAEADATRAHHLPGAVDGAAAASSAPGALHGQPHLRPGLFGADFGCHLWGQLRRRFSLRWEEAQQDPLELTMLSLVIGLPFSMLMLVAIKSVIDRFCPGDDMDELERSQRRQRLHQAGERIQDVWHFEARSLDRRTPLPAAAKAA